VTEKVPLNVELVPEIRLNYYIWYYFTLSSTCCMSSLQVNWQLWFLLRIVQWQLKHDNATSGRPFILGPTITTANNCHWRTLLFQKPNVQTTVTKPHRWTQRIHQIPRLL